VVSGKSLIAINRGTNAILIEIEGERMSLGSQEKSRGEISFFPYQQPTQVDWYQCTKMIGRTMLKELCKAARRNLGRCRARRNWRVTTNDCYATV